MGKQDMVCLGSPWFLLGGKIRNGAELFPAPAAGEGCGQLQNWQGCSVLTQCVL